MSWCMVVQHKSFCVSVVVVATLSQMQLDFVCYSAVLDVYVLCRHILKFSTLFEQDEACVNMEFSLEIKIAELNIPNSAFEYCDVLKYQDGGTNINKNSRWFGRETKSKSQQANIQSHAKCPFKYATALVSSPVKEL